MHFLIQVVSSIAIIAHEKSGTDLIEFGRYIQTLVVLLGPSFKYSGVSKTTKEQCRVINFELLDFEFIDFYYMLNKNSE